MWVDIVILVNINKFFTHNLHTNKLLKVLFGFSAFMSLLNFFKLNVFGFKVQRQQMYGLVGLDLRFKDNRCMDWLVWVL